MDTFDKVIVIILCICLVACVTGLWYTVLTH